ncbi:hypothetical protein Tco_1020288 [Tanacetum coccineum]|uniref:Uncharacterized protein n=1 Tax=Tanacetum coccineum TaxID=301880 RepID=A0ABQ5G0Y1_9ASTR
MINGERQLQALVDKKKVIIMETSIRSDLHLDDAGGIDCFPTATIFEELARMSMKPSKSLHFIKLLFSIMEVLIHYRYAMPKCQDHCMERIQTTQCFGNHMFGHNPKFVICLSLDLEKAKSCSSKGDDGLRKRVQKLGKKKEARTIRRSDNAEMFDTDDLHGDEVIVDMAVGEKKNIGAKLIEREHGRCKEKEEESQHRFDWNFMGGGGGAKNTQAMMEDDRLLAERLQTREQEELTDEEKAKLWDKLESDKSKKQKTDENEEVEVDNEAELKKHMVTVKDDDIAIDAIPLATKPPVIVEYKLIREGIMGHYQLIRADGSFKRYSSMIRMLQGIDREDLQTLWKLVKTKHGDTRPEDEHERVLWGDLKVMFEPDIKSDVWRNLQGYKVTV